MKTIILANATLNSGNRGCVALCVSSMLMIDKIMSDIGEEYKLYLLDSFEPLGVHTKNIMDTRIEYENILYPIPFNIKELIWVLIYLKDCIRSLKLLFKADCIIDIGQGDSFSDIYGAKRFRRIDRIHRTARVLNKKYLFLPQTIGPFFDKKVIKKARKSLISSSLVMTRDSMSFNQAVSIVGGKGNVKNYIDLAFILPYCREELKTGLINVGLNVSALLWNGGYTGDNQFNLNYSYREIIDRIIQYFLNNTSVMLFLVPHVVQQERYVENDYEVSYEIVKSFNHPRLKLSPFFLGPIEAKNFISSLDFFIGARMHSTIAAFSSAVPVIPMAYSRKFNGIFIDDFNYNYLVDMKSESIDSSMNIIKTSFDSRDIIKSKISEVLEKKIDPAIDILLSDMKKNILGNNDN